MQIARTLVLLVVALGLEGYAIDGQIEHREIAGSSRHVAHFEQPNLQRLAQEKRPAGDVHRRKPNHRYAWPITVAPMRHRPFASEATPIASRSWTPER
jgi:hypothetical protein